MTQRKPQNLVVGASGQIGNQILRVLPVGSAIPTSRHGKGPGWSALDLSTLSKRVAEDLISRFNLDTVYCIGGMTHVDDCESKPELAMRTNCDGPAILAAAAAKNKAAFVYFSTDYIFNGQHGPYVEDAPGDPISAYGRSKWRGEAAVSESHPKPLIIRTTVVYGPDPNAKNFLYSLHRELSAGRSFRVANDQMSTPTYNVDLAAATVALVEAGRTGIFHIAGPDLVSRVGFAYRAAKALGLSPTGIQGVPTSQLRQIAPRPLRGGLLAAKLSGNPEIRMRSIEEAISDWRATAVMPQLVY